MYRALNNIHIFLVESQSSRMNQNIGFQILLLVFVKPYWCTQLSIRYNNIVVHIKEDWVYYRVLVYFCVEFCINVSIILHQIGLNI